MNCPNIRNKHKKKCNKSKLPNTSSANQDQTAKSKKKIQKELKSVLRGGSVSSDWNDRTNYITIARNVIDSIKING